MSKKHFGRKKRKHYKNGKFHYCLAREIYDRVVEHIFKSPKVQEKITQAIVEYATSSKGTISLKDFEP